MSIALLPLTSVGFANSWPSWMLPWSRRFGTRRCGLKKLGCSERAGGGQRNGDHSLGSSAGTWHTYPTKNRSVSRSSPVQSRQRQAAWSLPAMLERLVQGGIGRARLTVHLVPLTRRVTRPPLRPFSRLARRLASLRTKPPSLPSGTAWEFLRFLFFMTALHSTPPGRTRADF
jgi:hypothetical protein